MKLPLTILLFFSVISCFGQEKDPNIVSISLDIPYKPATILLFKNGSRVDSAYASYDHYILFPNLSSGYYKIIMNGQGRREVKDSVLIKFGQHLELNVKLHGDCAYDHPKDYTPLCQYNNHTDNIIPIVYGLPAPETMKKANKGKVYLGGCMVTDCDPHYYCTIHKVSF